MTGRIYRIGLLSLIAAMLLFDSPSIASSAISAEPQDQQM